MLLEYRDYVERQETILEYSHKQKSILEKLQGMKGMNTKPASAEIEYKPKTTPAIKQLLSRQQLQKELYGQVRLEPFLICQDYMIEVEFKIGTSYMYVLKDVFAFVDAVEKKENYSYGQKLQFVHDMKVFDEDSRKLVVFLENWVENRRSGAAHRGHRGQGVSGGYQQSTGKRVEGDRRAAGTFYEDHWERTGN